MGMTTERIQGGGAAGIGVAVLAAFGATFAVVPAAGAQEIGEIVVTARRVEEKLKDVPLAITAFDSATIEQAAIVSLTDVAALTPGLSFFNAFGENLPVPVIRGIVPQDIFGVNAAAIFVDGVYVSGREGLNFSQLDVERIEVLKGPQSAMYGRNAFSGAINYVTRAPSDVFESKAEVEGGNRGKQKVLGQISGPIWGDALTARFSALYDEWDGSYDNTLAPENDIGGYRYRSLQGRLRWRPADRVDVNFGLYYSNDEIDDSVTAGLPSNCEDRIEQTQEKADQQPFQRLQNVCGKIPDLEDLPDALYFDQFPNRVINPNSITDDSLPKIPEALGEDRELWRGNLNIAWDLDIGTFTFLTGYSDTEQSSLSDFGRSSGNTIPLAYCVDADTSGGIAACQPPFGVAWAPMGFLNRELGATVEEWSQEIRFTSPADRALRYSIGGYYFTSELLAHPGVPAATRTLPVSIFDVGIGPVAYPTALAIGSFIFAPSLTPDGGIDPLGRTIQDEDTESWSVFGSMDYDLTDAWEARLEARLSKEAQTKTSYDYMLCGPDADIFPFNTPDPACGDDYFDLRELGAEHSDRGSDRFSTVTGRVGLKYKFESGWMGYGSIARGEKPGGLQVFRANVITGTGTAEELIENDFDPEKITAYELGLKGYTADRRVGLDMSVFFNDWTDIVLRQLTENSPVSGLKFEQPTSFNTNAGDARVWGWEASADIAMTDNLTGRLTFGYTDSELTNARMDTYALFPTFYTNDPTCTPAAIQALPVADQDAKAGHCRTISGDVSGMTQMRQPEMTASASLTYRHQLAGDWDWFARTDANYLDRIYTGNDNQSYLPSRTNVNLRLGFESARYSLEFWVRNLFDNDNPVAAFRDIYWTNDSDIQGLENPASIREASNFDDFPPLRMTISYPSLRTYGMVAKVRFGGAER